MWMRLAIKPIAMRREKIINSFLGEGARNSCSAGLLAAGCWVGVGVGKRFVASLLKCQDVFQNTLQAARALALSPSQTTQLAARRLSAP
jgi:hypothetical protein